MFSRILRGLLLAVLAAALFPGAALADWRASGIFKYQEREFDETGFTGNQPSQPIRLARVEVRDPNKNGGQALLATTHTDQSGTFSVLVTDSSTRTIAFRVLTTSAPVPGLFLRDCAARRNGDLHHDATASQGLKLGTPETGRAGATREGSGAPSKI